MASTRRRVVGKGAGGSGGAAPGEAAAEPARHISEAELEVFTHTDFLTRENLRQELPRLLQQLVSPSPDVGDGAGRKDVFRLLAEAHFAAEAQMSHPLGYALGSAQIAALLRMLHAARRVLFPRVDVIVLRSLFDEQQESAALEVKLVFWLRGLRLRVPLLAEVFCELCDRKGEGEEGRLKITYWSQHLSLRSLATMLPGPLARRVDWAGRRAVALAAERLVGLFGSRQG